MDDCKITTESTEKEIYCNCCGKPIAKNKLAATYVDHLHIEKSWGYFSSKDLTRHSFNICEKCYDEWVSKFTIPIEEFPIEELRICSAEEIEQLNRAYQAELAK